jgi:hypothetical protein
VGSSLVALVVLNNLVAQVAASNLVAQVVLNSRVHQADFRSLAIPALALSNPAVQVAATWTNREVLETVLRLGIVLPEFQTLEVSRMLPEAAVIIPIPQTDPAVHLLQEITEIRPALIVAV